MLQNWKDSTTSEPDSLLVVWQHNFLDTSFVLFSDSVIVVVPFRGGWEGAVDGPNQLLIVRHLDLGTDENVVTKHELRIQSCHAFVLGEREPHGSHERVRF